MSESRLAKRDKVRVTRQDDNRCVREPQQSAPLFRQKGAQHPKKTSSQLVE